MILDLGTVRPLHRAVYAALRAAILAGDLPGGSRLPGSRSLARDLAVSRIVVTTAYDQLVAEGYLVASGGAGTRVALDARANLAGGPLPARSAGSGAISAYARRAQRLMPHARAVRVKSRRGLVDFAYASFVPDAQALRDWRRAIGRAAAEPRFEYPDPSGDAELRDLLCRHLRRYRGVVADAEDVLIVAGSQQALDVTARALCEAEVQIGIEDPHYQGARQAFLAAGARLVPCGVDEDGFDIARHAARLQNVRALYVTPSHQFPTGAVMKIERRMRLLAWAAERDAWLIEDDYDSEFRIGAGAVPALQGLDARGCTIYVGTFARTLSPSVRLGYVVVPAALREAYRAIKWMTDRGTSSLEQRALADFLRSGAYERSQRRMARALGERTDRLVRTLDAHLPAAAVRRRGAGAGAHIFLDVLGTPRAETGALLERAERAGVRVYDGAPYFMQAPTHATLLCGYATLSPSDIERGTIRLAEILIASGGDVLPNG